MFFLIIMVFFVTCTSRIKVCICSTIFIALMIFSLIGAGNINMVRSIFYSFEYHKSQELESNRTFSGYARSNHIYLRRCL